MQDLWLRQARSINREKNHQREPEVHRSGPAGQLNGWSDEGISGLVEEKYLAIATNVR